MPPVTLTLRAIDDEVEPGMYMPSGHGQSRQGGHHGDGNTSALRGRAGFAPTKAAERILADAIARELGPKGVLVAYLVIDAVIDVPWTRERYKDKPNEFFIQPAVIAEEMLGRSQP